MVAMGRDFENANPYGGWLQGVVQPFATLAIRVMLWMHDALKLSYGWVLVALGVLVRLILWPLQQGAMRSQLKMQRIQPELKRIQEKFKDDREKLNKEMIEVYRRHKVNPLSGCLPMLVQLPVFLGLYNALMQSIELRHAPFILWIHDLAALDPYFVMPILMTVTMVIQTKLNPVPPDPVQAKVMQFMPYIFSIFFFFFPAGLVLYWLVNNILSILQQWQIQRMFDRDKPAHAKR